MFLNFTLSLAFDATLALATKAYDLFSLLVFYFAYFFTFLNSAYAGIVIVLLIPIWHFGWSFTLFQAGRRAAVLVICRAGHFIDGLKSLDEV